MVDAVVDPAVFGQVGRVHQMQTLTAGKPASGEAKLTDVGGAVPIAGDHVRAQSVQVETVAKRPGHCQALIAKRVIPTSARAASWVGATTCSTSPIARLPPTPA